MDKRDERGRDIFGFVEDRCPHCNAHLHLGDEPGSRPICLNACMLPTWQYRLMQEGLRQAKARIDAENTQ